MSGKRVTVPNGPRQYEHQQQAQEEDDLTSSQPANQRMNLFTTLVRTLRRRLSSSGRRSKLSTPRTDCQQIDDTIESLDGPIPSPSSNSTHPSSHVRSNVIDANHVAAAEDLVRFHASAVALLQDTSIYVNFSSPGDHVMARERRELSKHGWYWGPITRSVAQMKLNRKPNGHFLVRDSQNYPFQFTISFRNSGCTLHTRINYEGGYWNINSGRYKTMLDLVEDMMRESKNSILCYVLQNHAQLVVDSPVQFQIPVCMFVESSLQHLCRLSIQNHLLSQSRLEELPLPKQLIGYLMQTTFDSV